MTGTVQLPSKQDYRFVLGIVQEAHDALESLALRFDQDEPTGLTTASEVRSLLSFTEGLLANVQEMTAHAELFAQALARVDIARLEGFAADPPEQARE